MRFTQNIACRRLGLAFERVYSTVGRHRSWVKAFFVGFHSVDVGFHSVDVTVTPTCFLFLIYGAPI